LRAPIPGFNPLEGTMSRYAVLVLSLCLFFLAAFLVAVALDVPLLTGTDWIRDHAHSTAVVILNGLLIGDVLLPIPSSLLMVANGALLGTLPGAVATMVSTLLGGVLAFWLGRQGAPWLIARISDRERAQAERFFTRWGALAVLVSRPVPIIAETIGILAGTTHMSWTRFLLSVAAGNLPPAILYAFAGASAKNASYSVAIFLILVGLAGAWWFLGHRAEEN
jgi:uncharacterized membrane protein YdjX (TVP38/TMEM64 family)